MKNDVLILCCEVCCAEDAEGYEEGWFCEIHRPRTPIIDLLTAAEKALDEERWSLAQRLVGMIRDGLALHLDRS